MQPSKTTLSCSVGVVTVRQSEAEEIRGRVGMMTPNAPLGFAGSACRVDFTEGQGVHLSWEQSNVCSPPWFTGVPRS